MKARLSAPVPTLPPDLEAPRFLTRLLPQLAESVKQYARSVFGSRMVSRHLGSDITLIMNMVIGREQTESRPSLGVHHAKLKHFLSYKAHGVPTSQESRSSEPSLHLIPRIAFIGFLASCH